MLLERWGVEVLLLFLGLNSWDDGGAPFCAEEDRVRDRQTGAEDGALAELGPETVRQPQRVVGKALLRHFH